MDAGTQARRDDGPDHGPDGLLEHGLEHGLPEPQEGECVVCFVARCVEELGCDATTRWSRRFRQLRVPGATGLENRLGAACDCRVLAGGYRLARELMERDVHTDELRAPDRLPWCGGVRRTSSRPCGNCERLRRSGAGLSACR
jgi:hypothetical protein